MIPHRWRRSAADNGFSDPNADVRPGRFANTVLGSIRGLMASGAASRDDAIGGLVAALGAANVYAVGTNEGLIDIATGINGVPPAIKAPFLLRLSFDTTLTGSATNVPHLKVDGFDCGPMLNRDAGALADGDLVKGRPVLLLGEFAAPTDTQVTRVRLLNATPSEIVAAAAAAADPRATGVRIANSPATPDSLLTVSVARITLPNASGGAVPLTGVAGTINTGVSGAGGVDIGQIAPNTPYDLYGAYNPITATFAAFATVEGNAPTLPAGFTGCQRLGWCPTDGSGRWMRIQITDERWRYVLAAAGASNTTSLPVAAYGVMGGAAYAPLSLAGLVPRRSRRVDMIGMGLALGNNFAAIAPNPNYGLPSASPPLTSHLYASTQDNSIGFSTVSQMFCDLEAQPDGVPRIWAILQASAALLVLGGTLNP